MTKQTFASGASDEYGYDSRDRQTSDELKQGADDVTVLNNPTTQQVDAILASDDIEGFVGIGHGVGYSRRQSGLPGYLVLNGDDDILDSTDMFRISGRRHRKMKVALLFSCNSSMLAPGLLTIAEKAVVWDHEVGYWDTVFHRESVVYGK